jgi:predicted DNA-binding protein
MIDLERKESYPVYLGIKVSLSMAEDIETLAKRLDAEKSTVVRRLLEIGLKEATRKI